MITEYMKPRSDMKSLFIPEEERVDLIKGPHHRINKTGDIITFTMQFGDTLDSCYSFLEENEVKNKKCENYKLMKEEQKKIRCLFLRIPDMSKCKHRTCEGCGNNIMYECH